MSFSDFQFRTVEYTNNPGLEKKVIILSSSVGLAIPNNSLQNPLPSEGYCRFFGSSNYEDTANTNIGSEYISIKGVLPSYNNIANNKAISIRAKLRVQGGIETALNSTSNRYCHYIGITGYSNIALQDRQFAGSTLTGSIINFQSGYTLALQTGVQEGTTSTYQTKLVLKASKFGPISSTQPEYNTIATCTGTYAKDTWYHVRLDIIPLSLSSKILRVFVTYDDGNNWVNVLPAGSILINQTDSLLWCDSGHIGLAYYQHSYFNNSYELIPSNTGGFIDDLKISINEITGIV